MFVRDPATGASKVWVLSVAGERKTPVTGIQPRAVVVAWTADGKGLLVFERGTIPTQIVRVDVATGRREPWRTFASADPAGIRGIDTFEITPDGRLVAYYQRVLSQLFLVEGLK